MPAIRKSGGRTANRYFWNGIGIQKDGRGRQNGRERGSTDKMEDKENFSVSEGHMDPALEEANTSEAVREGKAPFYNMKRGFSRIGWSLVAVLGIWQILMLLIGFAAIWQEELYDLPAVSFYNRYLLLFNEGTLAAALIVGSFLLRPIPCSAPARRPFSGGRFFQLLCICFAVSIAGSLIGSLFLSLWNAVSGSSVGNAVSEVIFETDPWLNLLTVGLLAPVLEELFFRKLLIDRMYRYGEKICILLSALLFALFHMNFSQFFYAFGAGVILAYLYCRSGKIWLCILLHAVFNCFSGVLNSEIAGRLIERMDSIAGMTNEELAALTFSDLSIVLVALFYYLLFFGLAIAGLVLFCVKIRRFRFQPGEIVIPEKARSVVFLNAGMMAALIFTIGMMVYSLFV